MAADGSTFAPKLPSLAEQLAELGAILRASPGYGKANGNSFDAPEEDDDCEPTAEELRRNECTWSV